MDWCRGQAYSQDLRLRVLAASDQGLSARVVAVQFTVSVPYVIKARQRRDRTGEARALKPRQTQVHRLAGHGEALRGRVAEKSGATLAELRLAAQATWRVGRHDRAVAGAGPHGPDAQKKSQQAAEQSRPDLVAARAAWRAAQPGLTPGNMVFIDG